MTMTYNGNRVFRRDWIANEYTIAVCARTGQPCIDPDCEAGLLEVTVVPVQRLRELERGRDHQAEEIRRYQRSSVAIQIGEETLTGTRQAVTNVRATLEHLKAKARSGLPGVSAEGHGDA